LAVSEVISYRFKLTSFLTDLHLSLFSMSFLAQLSPLIVSLIYICERGCWVQGLQHPMEFLYILIPWKGLGRWVVPPPIVSLWLK